jgi:P27 family predicted phage terminase small subunit
MAARKREPVATGDLREPPEWMSEEQCACWHHAIANAPPGVLATIDFAALVNFVIAYDTLCDAVIKIREEGSTIKVGEKRDAKGRVKSTGTVIPNPYVSIRNKAQAALARCSNDLGFTPCSRPRLTAAMGDDAFFMAPRYSDEDDDVAELEALLARKPPSGAEMRALKPKPEDEN